MASGPPVCLLCRTTVTTKDRRIIRSTKNAEPVLLEYMSELRPSSKAAILHDRAFLCRPCLRSVDKLHNLRQETKKLEADIKHKIEYVIEPYRQQDQRQRVDEQISMQFCTPEKRTSEVAEPLTPTGASNQDRYDTLTVQRKKRPRSSGAEAGPFTPTTSATKRGRYDTPTRTTLHKMIPVGSSPAVAVSTAH